MKRNEIMKKMKKWNKIFCRRMTCRTNLGRDLIIVAISIVSTSLLLIYLTDFHRGGPLPENIIEDPQEEIFSGVRIYEEIERIQHEIDTEKWDKYSNSWYGFGLKYPDGWTKPKSLPATGSVQWEYRYQFRKSSLEEEDIYSGFDVVIYSVSKIAELDQTDEFPKLLSEELKNDPECGDIEDHLIETGDYPAEEIYVPFDDNCYDPALFFSFTREEYIYNFVPAVRAGKMLEGDPGKIIDDDFPEFYAMIATAELTDIIRPKPQPAKPKAAAPHPVSYKVVNGRMVCAKENDKPAKSIKDKGRHLDMECCLDPDEYPNPHCYYDPKKYGKYL